MTSVLKHEEAEPSNVQCEHESRYSTSGPWLGSHHGDPLLHSRIIYGPCVVVAGVWLRKQLPGSQPLAVKVVASPSRWPSLNMQQSCMKGEVDRASGPLSHRTFERERRMTTSGAGGDVRGRACTLSMYVTVCVLGSRKLKLTLCGARDAT